MTTYIDFVPSQVQPFQFQATLDGTVYTVLVTWNVFRQGQQGYYITISTLGNMLVGCIACVGSPLNYDISLSAPFGFTSTLVYRTQNNQFEINS